MWSLRCELVRDSSWKVIAGVDRGIRGALRGLFTFGITGLDSVRRERLEEISDRRDFSKDI